MNGEKTDVREHPVLKQMVGDLARDAGARLRSVVLYGSAARGEFHRRTSDLNLIVVLEDLEPATLEALEGPVRAWTRRGQPAPRLFTPTSIAAAADVFPIELLDVAQRRVVLHGPDPFAGLAIQRGHLRLQCEREMREKLMHLAESYVEAHRRPRALRRLLTDSYTSFVALFRGCLHLMGGEVPVHNLEVVAAFCARAELDASAFRAVERLKRGDPAAGDPRALFSRYYAALGKAVEAVDRFDPQRGGTLP